MKKKIILFTGASSGMGKAGAQKLLEEGHIVYGAARRVEKMQFLKEAGGFPIKMDITVEKDVQNAVNTVIEAEGKIDVLINNAGYAVYGSVEDTSIEDAKRQFDVNLFGMGRITKLVLPHMRKQGSGRIINMSSMGGKMYTPLGAWYHASKHAVEGWSDCLRLELKPHNIDVVIIEPGIISTEFGEVMMDPLLKRSEGGAYEELAQAVANSTRESYQEGGGSSPEVIAKRFSRAVNSDNPRTRYSGGKYAKPLMWARKYLGDRIFDKVVMSQV